MTISVAQRNDIHTGGSNDPFFLWVAPKFIFNGGGSKDPTHDWWLKQMKLVAQKFFNGACRGTDWWFCPARILEVSSTEKSFCRKVFS
jgi:hypothetical protein